MSRSSSRPTTRCSAIPTRCAGWPRAAASSCSRSLTPLEAWRESAGACADAPSASGASSFYVVDAFAVAKKHAPTPELETRMMGIAFIGAVCRPCRPRRRRTPRRRRCWPRSASRSARSSAPRAARSSKSNMEVVREGLEATQRVDYDTPGFLRVENWRRRRRRGAAWRCRRRCAAPPAPRPAAASSTASTMTTSSPARFRDGTIGEAPVLPGAGPVHAARQRGVEGQGPVPAERAGIPGRQVYRLHGMRASSARTRRSPTPCTTSTTCC